MLNNELDCLFPYMPTAKKIRRSHISRKMPQCQMGWFRSGSMADGRAEKKKKSRPKSGTVLSPELTPFVEKSKIPPFLIVGIGASAGGLEAFEAFFSGMPTNVDPGMAFVLVQHLAPDHKSMLSEIVRHYTRMQVFEVENGMVVQPNCTYIIPPNHDMAFVNGALQLLPPADPRGHRLPVDFFFRSLAQDQRERAVGIVLSGTGCDGTAGARAIKAEGGMIMVQVPDSTEFDGMPRSAIDAGLVDYELAPAEMPAQLIYYATHAVGSPGWAVPVMLAGNEHFLKSIFILLRAQTGHDFSQYKPTTIMRRIERRMAVHRLESTAEYKKYLQETPAEVEALFCDLLIGVTSFFRDPDAFQALEQLVIPRLFEGKPENASIRVWCAGCSTGEEAYSIAILLLEHQEALKQSYTIQVFATDMDRRAIAIARAGIYPASIASDISPERLARFFSMEPDGSSYRVHKNIREMLVFSEHDIIKDPPFSKIDLVSCRNLLIYLDNELQKRVFPLFHYALSPGRYLFLGTSETVGEFGDVFSAVDAKSKLYQGKDDIPGIRRQGLPQFNPPVTVGRERPMTETRLSRPVKRSLRELTEKTLLQHLALAGVLVNDRGDILYLHGRTGVYLELPAGEAGINNILRMAREGLRHDLAGALQQAVASKRSVHAGSSRVYNNGQLIRVSFTVRPVGMGRGAAASSLLYLIVLEQAKGSETDMVLQATPLDGLPAAQPAVVGLKQETEAEKDARIARLTEELRSMEECLKATNEEMESADNDLRASNEELQSMNEELQSTNEELETSKEEMQSLAEELTTMNAEMQIKMTELSRASNDLNNLLASTGIGTVFIDHHLRILRFTAAATKIINLIPSDVGRPVAHTVTNLIGYENLVADTQAVLDTLIPREVKVQTNEAAWFLMRILPYRTEENVIEGAVITFIDITELENTRRALDQTSSMRRLAVVVRDAFDAITVQDLRGQTLAWNPGATRMYGWSETEALLMNVADRIPQELREGEMARAYQLSRAVVLEPYHTRRIGKDGNVVDVSLTATALVNESGEIYAIATTERSHEYTKIH
jgi:two-component system CheB/CheR fusion protein